MKKQWFTIFVMNVFFAGCLLTTSCSHDYGDEPKVGDENEEETLDPSLQGSNYYLLSLDSVSGSAIKNKIVSDLQPNGTTRLLALWADSYIPAQSLGKNFYGENLPWKSYTVGTQGWSACAYYMTEPFDLTKIDSSYTFHIAMMSVDNADHAIKFIGSDGVAAGIGIGKASVEGILPYTDFERDGKWHEIEIPVKDLIGKGLRYDAPVNAGNVIIVLSGGTTGTALNMDAIFFYKKKAIK